MTTIVNTYGGPGTGKSTTSFYIAYLLKDRGVNAELVQEYVKGWAWEGRKIGPYDQWYFLGHQIRRESLLFGKVDYIVTDSPILLGAYYASLYSPPDIKEAILTSVKGYYKQCELDGHKHVHVKLQRSKPYNPAGRYQSEDQAKEADSGIFQLLDSMGIIAQTRDTIRSDIEQMVDSLLT